MKHILLPTDFSKNAYNAINYALELYKNEPCKFFILNTYYLPGFDKSNLLTPEPSEEKLNSVKEISENNMQVLKASINLENKHHSFEFITKLGPFGKALKKMVEKENINLIMMGTLGKTNDSETILGSNAVNTMEIIRKCPVFTIPGDVAFKAPNEIVFPTSYKTHYIESEMATLIEIARITKAPIRILYIKTDKKLTQLQEDKKTLLSTILKDVKFTHHELYNKNMQEGVRCFWQSRESDMIAFINKEHSFFGSIFSNPLIKNLGQNANVPILALHDLRN